jgi:hypothetical protein
MKAINVLDAAEKAFRFVGDSDYASSKSKVFLKRCFAECGITPSGRLDQEIDLNSVKKVVFAMLDPDVESKFWSYLGELC